MKIAPLAEVKDRLSAYIEAAKESSIVVTRNGRPVALLTPIGPEDDLESLLLTHDRRFARLLRDARDRVGAGHALSAEQFWPALERRNPRRAPRRPARTARGGPRRAPGGARP